MSIVYMTREITPESLVRIYRALGVSLPGSAAVKISTGEPGGRNFLQPELIRNLVQELKGTIVECNTAYEGRRNTSKAHWETMRDHGFTAIAPCDILDEEGHMPLPVTGRARYRPIAPEGCSVWDVTAGRRWGLALIFSYQHRDGTVLYQGVIAGWG